jgi:F-type H+-transporting ATPase subunit a
MNATMRGALIFGGIVVFLALCAIFTFGFLPSQGIAVAVPVIMVPGEPYDPTLPVDSFRWTNTLTATLLATIAVVVFIALAWRSSKGWTREVPTRFQSWVELLVGFMYNLTRQIGGERNGRMLFPLVGALFVFLLAANWMKLLPGIESVGVLHCAEDGFNGYPAVSVGNEAYQLYNSQPLNVGLTASHESYEACHHWKDHGAVKPSAELKNQVANRLEEEEAALRAELTAQGVADADIDTQVEALRLELLEELYEHPTYAISADAIRAGAIPYHFVITPFVRGASTDLNLTLALAIISVIAIQVFGVIANGPDYFQKFINLRALGNLSKKPLGAIDFVVGIFEIISEIGKMVSLAFRLFGNMFAGGILLIVMSFLAAAVLPMIFIGLELIITTIQALVFAVLTLVFASQAMEGHHGDDHGHEEAAH